MTTQNKVAYTAGHTLMVVMVAAICFSFRATTLDALAGDLLAAFGALCFGILMYAQADPYP